MNTKISMSSAFTLVELLVVITILAIISIVAYQHFGWAIDKAVSWRKISDISTIETGLQQFYTEKKYYPMPLEYSSWNLWGYNSWEIASPSNTIRVVYNGQEISEILTWSTKWWGRVYGTWIYGDKQIGAKWVIWHYGDFNKKYLSKDLYDPEVGDIKLPWGKKLIDYWIGRYVYAIYSEPKTPDNWNVPWTLGKYYNIATTIKEGENEKYKTYIQWDYDEKACWENSAYCPQTLLGTLSGGTVTWVLLSETYQNDNPTTHPNQWVPYPVVNFSK